MHEPVGLDGGVDWVLRGFDNPGLVVYLSAMAVFMCAQMNQTWGGNVPGLEKVQTS